MAGPGETATPAGESVMEITAPEVLLVCTANICRSPMAEVLWREADAGHRRSVRVASVGVDAEPGRPADPTCVELMALRGLDLSEHRAMRFRADLSTACELILVMEPAHGRRILAQVPTLAGRVQLLGRWGAGGIEDPYRRETSIYMECIELLENSVKSWLNRLP